MDILIVMCMGILVGRLFRSGRIKKVNELLSLACTFVLIFAMGGTLGQRKFCPGISFPGRRQLPLFAFPTFFSIVFVYILTRNFMGRKKYETRGKKRKMIILFTFISLLGGLAYGIFGFHIPAVSLILKNTDGVLYALMFLSASALGCTGGF